VILAARLHTSKFQLILCFNIDLKELKDSAIFSSWGRLFPMQGTIITEAPLAEFFFRA
jgi:hypothetical protein